MRRLLTHCLAVSLTIGLAPFCYAQSPINSTQDGRIIQGGTYYNTPNSHTTFLNSHSGDLWLQSGNTVRGLEVNGSGNLTNNGGNIQLYAPKSVVRVDGNIDVSGIINGQGAYLGNGGKVQVNATYLYQNGSITALGNQGGHVNINVNSATFGPLAKIDTSSPTGLGGSIRVNASGVVDIQNGASMTASGLPMAGVDANVIAITGRVVNNEGILNANGILTTAGQVTNGSTGGVIQLIANNGNPNLQQVSKALNASTVFTPTESSAILTRLQELTNNYANSIRNTGSIIANGGTESPTSALVLHGGNGGSISLDASSRILNSSLGVIAANGGGGDNGGTGGQIQLFSQHRNQLSQNDGVIQANGGLGSAGADAGPLGFGGNGGQITLRNLLNNGTFSANGGDGSVLNGGFGGKGGSITALNVTNALNGSFTANGGFGSGQSNGQGGDGGTMTAVNFTNNGLVALNGGGSSSTNNNNGGNGGKLLGTNVINTGTISATGGFAGGRGRDIGGAGGSMQITNLTNSGTINANGGGGDGGGHGGQLNFSRVNNSGTISANGGSTYNNQFGTNLPAGDGGTIIGAHTTNTGTVQALGGISGFSPSLNGKDGTVIGF